MKLKWDKEARQRQDEIVIVDFWDTRMNPKTLLKRLQNKL